MYCKYCEEEKPSEAFRKHSRKCKPCQAAYSDKWRKQNPEKAKASREHFLATHKEQQRDYKRKRWHGGKETWRKRHRLERNASALANHAARTGRIEKAKECQVCSRNIYLVGHHQDYHRPLAVIWVCQSCHRKIHYGTIQLPEHLQLAPCGSVP
jgi:hypothetical protein